MASELSEFASPAERPLEADEAIPLTVPTVVAFIGRAERGPVNEPVYVKSFDDYRRVFGGHCAFSFVSVAVQHFFLHGGEIAVVVRIANRAKRALLELPAGTERLLLQARQPGSRELLRVSIDYDRVEHYQDRFNLVIQRLGRPGSQLVDDQELFEGLSMDETDDRFVVDTLHASRLVRLIGPLPLTRPDATRAARPGEAIPYLTATRAGSDGDDLTDYDVIGSSDDGTGLFALDRCERVDLVCVPSPPGQDLGSTSFVAATRYCQRRRALLIWDPPWSWANADQALLGIRSSEHVSRHAITYFPRVRLRGEATERYPGGLPASGVLAGILARCDRDGVWHTMPPHESGLKGNLAPLVDVTGKQAVALCRAGINAFTRVQPGAAVLHGNVSAMGTTAIDSRWQRLGVSRLIAFVIRSIERHTRWVYAAPHGNELPDDLERQVWLFLLRLQQRGALAGKTPEQSFYARVSARRSSRDGSTVTLRVGFAPERANSFVTYDFRYGERSTATEVTTAEAVTRYA